MYYTSLNIYLYAVYIEINNVSKSKLNLFYLNSLPAYSTIGNIFLHIKLLNRFRFLFLNSFVKPV